jgi:ABC-type uncharacterized transport system auxiliary subunit
MKQFWCAILLVAVAIAAFLAGRNSNPAGRYQLRIEGTLDTVFDSKTGVVYVLQTNGVNRVNFPEHKRIWLPFERQ